MNIQDFIQSPLTYAISVVVIALIKMVSSRVPAKIAAILNKIDYEKTELIIKAIADPAIRENFVVGQVIHFAKVYGIEINEKTAKQVIKAIEKIYKDRISRTKDNLL